MNIKRTFLTALALALPLAGANAVTFTSDTTISSGNASYDGQPIIVSGCTLTVDGPHAFASLFVTNAGWIRHPDPASNRFDFAIAGDIVVATNSAIYGNARLVVQGNVFIAPGGGLIANYRGYPIGTNNGPGAGGASVMYGAGAGYGGPGGNGSSGSGISRGGPTYGNPLQPMDRGSAGGHGGGAGGGVLQLDVAGTLTVDGYLSANGDTPQAYWSGGGGGSGGGIWINAGMLAGAGTITANAGNGDLYYSVGGGGGGGRIAIYCGTNLFTGTTGAWPGVGAEYGGPGTLFIKKTSDSLGEIILDAGGLTAKPNDVSSLSGARLTVSNSATVFATQALTLASLRMGAGGTFTHSAGTGAVNLTITGDATIDVGGSINANACGYFASTNAGPGAGVSGGGGAGHGGNGGDKYTGVKGGAAYGSILWPTNYGSRGGDGTYGSGGSGGGAIQLNVGGTLTVNGRLSAEGGMVGLESAAGSGSGGSVLVTAQTLAGSGAISVAGGVGDYSYWYGGGGGAGGRAALRVSTNSFTGTMTAQGGAGKARGGAGTIFIKLATETLGTVRVDNGADSGFGGTTPISAPEAFHLTLSNYALVTFPQPATFGNLVVGSNVWVTFPTNGVPLDLVVLSNAALAASAQILADGFGYPISGDAGLGVGAISNSVGGGAGHGGGGGIGSTGAKGGRAYGSATEPVTFGSQGGPSSAGSGGAGGGVVRLTVGGTLALNGRISADGSSASAGNAGGGAGGSVFLDVGALSGSGPLWALGGAGNGSGGGGGGGRVAIYGSLAGFNTNNLLVTGGTGYQSGTNGTVYLAGYVAPRILEHRPAGFTTSAPDYFDVDFDQGIDPASFTPDLAQVTGPFGPISTAQVSVTNVGGRTWRISFPPQTSNGTLNFTIAPGARSLFGLATTTAYSGSFEIRLERYLLLSRTGNTLRLDWATSLGSTYQLQTSTSLTSWSDFGPAWPGTGGMLTTNVPIGSELTKFFRLEVGN